MHRGPHITTDLEAPISTAHIRGLHLHSPPGLLRTCALPPQEGSFSHPPSTLLWGEEQGHSQRQAQAKGMPQALWARLKGRRRVHTCPGVVILTILAEGRAASTAASVLVIGDHHHQETAGTPHTPQQAHPTKHL